MRHGERRLVIVAAAAPSVTPNKLVELMSLEVTTFAVWEEHGSGQQRGLGQGEHERIEGGEREPYGRSTYSS